MHSPASLPANIVNVDGVSLTLGGETILRDIHLEVEPGDFLALIGPNGGGKSTLVRLMLGLLRPTSGRILCSEKLIGYVPQNTDINITFPITVLDVVLMGHRRGIFGYSDAARQSAYDALRKVGLASYADARIGALSGGQRQRVMIARALQNDPKLLILDEPTSNIDPEGQFEIYELLKKLNADKTVIVVSHDISIVVQYAAKVAYVNRTLTFHDVSSMRTAFEANPQEHFCEVEMLHEMHHHRGCHHD